MITRKVDKDDPQAGFTYNWVKKLGQKIKGLKVICLEKGNIDGLGKNIEVFSMGKEKGKNRLKEFINFQKGAFKYIKQIDGIFVHMNPIYTILIAPYAKIFRKRLISWYSHRQVTWQVKLVALLADRILTPTKDGFRVKTKKKLVVGHGIDTDLFKPGFNQAHSKLKVISVGRISPIKNYETLIKAANILKKRSIDFEVKIIGLPGLASQVKYFDKLKQLVKEKELENKIQFVGGVPQYDLVGLYQQSSLSINLCPTGSPDKAVLESMACGLPVLVCNKTFERYLDNQSFFKEKDANDLAEKIIAMSKINLLVKGQKLREKIVSDNNLDNLMIKIVSLYL